MKTSVLHELCQFRATIVLYNTGYFIPDTQHYQM